MFCHRKIDNMVGEPVCLLDPRIGKSGTLSRALWCKVVSQGFTGNWAWAIPLLSVAHILDHVILGQYKITDHDRSSLVLSLASWRLPLLFCCVSSSLQSDNLLTEVQNSGFSSWLLFPGAFQIVGLNIERLEEKECRRCQCCAKDCLILNCVRGTK